MKKIKKSKIPEFKTYKEEAEFWYTHDSTQFLDEFEEVHDMDFSGLKQLVSIRIPEKQIKSLKKVASHYGIGYLTMTRMWITERLREELKKKAA